MDNKTKNKGFANPFKGVANFCKKVNEKNKYLESIFIIALSLIFAFGILTSVHRVMSEEIISIATNKAEEYYYEGKYDNAIEEYNKLQENEEWPIYKVKAAGVYSVKGEFNESNNLLKEAIMLKDKLLAKDSEKYLEKDKELINEVIFTFFMNGENEQALSLGEYYLERYSTYKPLLKTMFTIYMANGKSDIAEDIVKIYPVDKESAYDLAILSQMEIIVGNTDEALENLQKAYYLDKDEIKVFDVLEESKRYNGDILLEKLENLCEENEDEAYKLFLAKLYSMESKTEELSNEILNSLGTNIESVNFNLIKTKLFDNEYNNNKRDSALKKLIASEKNTYIGQYLTAWNYYDEEKYDKALEKCKESIISNRDYANNYGILMTKIMFGLNRADNIEAYIRTALYKEPFNYNIMVNSAEFYAENLADYKKTEEYYNLALGLVNNKDYIYYDLALLDIRQEKFEDAIIDLEQAISIDEDNGMYYRTLGTAYFNEKNNEKALENIKKAYELDENDVLSLNNAGCYYMLIDQDIYRGYDNISYAYEEMPEDLDEESKALITENYNKAKEAYDNFVDSSEKSVNIPNLKLSY